MYLVLNIYEIITTPSVHDNNIVCLKHDSYACYIKLTNTYT